VRDAMCPGMGEEEMEDEMPCEPAGHGEFATCSVSTCSPLWRTFVRNFVVMVWIEYGYRLMRAVEAPQQKEMENSSSSWEHREFVRMWLLRWWSKRLS